MNKFLTLNTVMGILLLSSSSFADYKPIGEFKYGPKNLTKEKMRTKGIKITPHKKIAIKHSLKKDFQNIQSFELKDIILDVADRTFIQEAALNYQNYIGTRVTSHDISIILSNLTKFYTNKGYLLPRPYVSEQNLANGTLKISIKLDSLNNVVIIGDGESNKLFKEYAKHILGETPSSKKTVQYYLGLMSKITGYDMQYSLREENPGQIEPSANPIDLVIVTSKRNGEILFDLENGGIKELGRYQPSILTQLHSPFKMNESILLSMGTTDKLNRFNNVALGVQAPVNSYGTSLGVLGAYSKDNPTKSFPVQASDNKLSSIRGHVSQQIIINPHQSLEAEAGIVYKDAKSFDSSNGVNQQLSYAKYTSGFIKSTFRINDSLGGKNAIMLNFVHGMDGKMQNYIVRNDIFKKHYSAVHYDLFREQDLINNFNYFAHIGGVYSKNKLPGDEKFFVGGHDFGRGYRFGTVDTDKGIGFSIELRYNYLTTNQYVKKLEPYIYYDLGKIFKKSYSSDNSLFESAGVGLKTHLFYDINLGMEVAFPFKKHFLVDGVRSNSNNSFNFYINKSFNF